MCWRQVAARVQIQDNEAGQGALKESTPFDQLLNLNWRIAKNDNHTSCLIRNSNDWLPIIAALFHLDFMLQLNHVVSEGVNADVHMCPEGFWGIKIALLRYLATDPR